MERNRKQKLLMIIALVFGIVSLSVGFAAFSATLNISSSASVTPSSDTFGVKFSTSKDSLVVGPVVPSSKTSGITATDGVIDNGANPTIKNLSATFTGPGQYVEYTFYARNEGEYTAYLNNISFLGEKTCKAESGATESLVQTACSYINILFLSDSRTYFENTPISGHPLNSKTGEVYTVRLEYLDAAPSADGPFSVTFPNIALVYSTINDHTFMPETNMPLVRIVSGDLNTPGSVVSIGDEQFYVFGQENGNVKLLSMYNLHVGNYIDVDWSLIPLSNPTGIQDSSARGSINGEFPIIGTTAFSNINATYSGSIVEGYVNNYASYLEGIGVNIEEARLITKEELEKLGCSSYTRTCRGAPGFVYQTSYWSGTASGSLIWVVFNNESFNDYYSFYEEDYVGVRPVIIISTSEF